LQSQTAGHQTDRRKQIAHGFTDCYQRRLSQQPSKDAARQRADQSKDQRL
jgi:hypothetical protein